MIIRLQERLPFTSPIVIVDEPVELVDAMVELLRKEYFPIPVIGHSASRQAAALIARERPSLLICNRNMQRVGGMDLVTLARKRWDNLPTVVLVGSGLGRDGNEKADGKTLYVDKPVALDTFCDRIATLSGAPPRSLLTPRPGAVLVEANQLTPELGQVDERPEQPRLVSLETLPLAAQNPTSTESKVGLAMSSLEAEANQWAVQGANKVDGSKAEVAFDQPAAMGKMEDRSLSSETPLPPPSPKSSEEAEDARSHNETMEVLDEEIELIDYPGGQRSADNDRSIYEGAIEMALTASNVKENLSKLETIEGFIGAALADSDSGMCVGYLGGGGSINLEVAAAANTEVVRSKRKAVKALNLRDDIEDILITLGKQYHLIRPVRSRPSLFFYLVLDRQRANLAMARFTLADTERELPM